MKSAGTTYTCEACDYRSNNWLGRCPSCSAWGSLREHAAASSRSDPESRRPRPEPYPQINPSLATFRSTGISELDRVLGGGLVGGAAILLGGEPGIGKSTLLLQAASALANTGQTVLYVSGEESAPQLRLRGDRLGVSSEHLLVLADSDVGGILDAAAETTPSLMIVDSIQAVRCRDVGSVPGSVAQVRECATRFVDFAKAHALPLILVGHVTKDGSIAGPRVLEHLVDTVVQFEGDRHHAHRILRALKNRFGPSDELGVFQMEDRGLREVTNPSEFFLSQRRQGVPGSCVLAAVEGSRPLLVEIQALVGEPAQGSPRRTVLGLDGNRVALILAVLQRRAGLEIANRDVFVNVTGGVHVDEPASDLAAAAAIASSFRGRPLPDGWIVAGEIGLTGEIRAVPRPTIRLREASRLGFDGAVIPAADVPAGDNNGIHVLPIRHLSDALDWMFPKVGGAVGQAG